MMDNHNTSPILRAVNLLGGITQLATACGVTPQAAYKWVNTKAPANRCIQIEMATSGQVTRYELRPDVFGVERRRKSRRAADRGRRNEESPQ